MIVITLITLGGGRYPWETARSDGGTSTLTLRYVHAPYLPYLKSQILETSNTPIRYISYLFLILSMSVLFFLSSILLRFLSTCFCHSFFLSLLSSTECSYSLFHPSIPPSLLFNSHHHRNIPPSNQTPLSQHHTLLFGIAAVCYLVLDEADRMLDDGFEPAIRQVS